MDNEKIVEAITKIEKDKKINDELEKIENSKYIFLKRN